MIMSNLQETCKFYLQVSLFMLKFVKTIRTKGNNMGKIKAMVTEPIFITWFNDETQPILQNKSEFDENNFEDVYRWSKIERFQEVELSEDWVLNDMDVMFTIGGFEYLYMYPSETSLRKMFVPLSDTKLVEGLKDRFNRIKQLEFEMDNLLINFADV